MKCNRCGSPLPSDGMVCKFCGALMDQKQISYQNKMKDKNFTLKEIACLCDVKISTISKVLNSPLENIK